MQADPPIGMELAALASHLHQRRAEVLAAWSRATQRDPDVTTSATLSRVQFYDHIPAMLDALESGLRADRLQQALDAKRDETEKAEGHGLQRWQQGYDDREVMREWIILNACLADEIDFFAHARPTLAPAALSEAWRRVAAFCVTGMSESVSQYARLQRAEAAARVAALETAVAQLGELERQRAEAWREAAHDLRGNLSIVENVTSIMQIKGANEKTLRMLGHGVASLTALLNDLMTQARLDAGHETRDVQPFDAAAALAELCANFAPLAEHRGLFLESEGPPALQVDGDRVKVCRIAQNLILNALTYTRRGGAKVTWEEVEGLPRRWTLCVQDTGPGIAANGAAPLAAALEAATRDGHDVERDGAMRGDPGADPAPAPTLVSRSPPPTIPAGEGIGLSIVKRLCELLDAGLELQTGEGKGSTFRVTFPSHYAKG